MKTTLKRTLCLLLALVMCLGLSVGALAEEESAGGVTYAAGAGDNSAGADKGENGGEEDPPVDAPEDSAQIAIKEDSLSAFVGDKITLEYLISPDTYSGTVAWDSSDETVATVKDGVVTAISAGTTTITAALDGKDGSSDSCEISVSEDKVTGFKVSCPEYKIGSNSAISITGRVSFTLAGTTTYDSGAEKDGAAWGEISDLYVVKRENDSGKFVTVGPGTATIEVICPNDDTKSQIITVTVRDAPLTSLSISGDGVTGGRASMDVGGTLKLSADKSPDTTFNGEAVSWSSSDDKTAWVDRDGTVTAVKKGTAKITAFCKEGSKTVSSSVTITVSEPSADINAKASRGDDLPFGGIYSSLRSKFKNAYGLNPSDSATVRFSSIGSSTYGTLYTTSAAAKTVARNTDYELSAVSKFCFTPAAAGEYVLSYTLTDDKSTVSGKITITVAGATTKNITISLSGEKDYAFNSSATTNKVSAASAISSAIKDASGTNYSYIVFDTPGSASKKVGTLYPDSGQKTDLEDYDSYCSGSKGTSRQSPVSKLYFSPKREGSYEIGYTAYDSNDKFLCSGDLTIDVGVADKSTVTITLDDEGSYNFSEKTKKDRESAASAIEDAVYDETDENYSYIKFDSVSSGSSVGTLYSDSGKSSVSTSRKYYRSTSSSYSVSDLYFVPEKAGTYVRGFTAYDSYDDKLLEGTLKIVVPSGGGASADMDIYFNTTTGSTVSLGESVFESWFRQQKGSSYKLAYVTFDNADSSHGTFKHSGSAFTPGSTTKYYTDSYSGSTGSSAKYLDNVKYTAPSSVGAVSVDFTCYGGTSASSSSTRLSGTFCIYVTKGSVKNISYNVKSGGTAYLDEDDFISVHKNAMSSGSSTAKYCVELLEVPDKGALYYNYSSSSKTGTKLTNSNFDDYRFYVNYSSSYDSVESLTYVPSGSSGGSTSVRYLARDTDGEGMYVGSVTFNCDAGQSASISCSSDGYTFRSSDFPSGSSSDPVAYLVFGRPFSGELMLDYVNGRGTPLDSSVKLYTSTYISGAYPISSLTYIPKAGFSGNVTVDYTAATKSGKTQSGTLTIAVSGKKSSSHFSDVTSSGSGAWASDSIDFAYKWGLVNGTGESTFSPDNTMSRAMLVTILYRAAGTPEASGGCKFNDVPADAYYYDAVIWASNNGIVTGTSETTFNPNRDVNREQVAAFLHRFAKYSGQSVSVSGGLSGYTDKSSVSGYAVEPVSWAVQNGYITSASTTEMVLRPGGNATRAQVAVMIHRFLTY